MAAPFSLRGIHRRIKTQTAVSGELLAKAKSEERRGIMRKKMMIPMIAIALVALVFFAGYGVMSETMAQADIDLVGEATPAESAITEPEIDAVTVVAAETEYEALLERAKGIEEKYGLEQQSDEEMQAADMERKKLSKDFARYYETYGWDQYDGDVYERDILTEMAEGAIDGLGDIIYMIENGIMSPLTDRRKKRFSQFLNGG